MTLCGLCAHVKCKTHLGEVCLDLYAFNGYKSLEPKHVIKL